MQSLDIIEKKMDKEIESSKSRSHRSHDERRRKRSVDRHHHHSPRHSARRAHSSSSPSLSGSIRGGLGWMSYREK
jgi:hypothetical protein